MSTRNRNGWSILELVIVVTIIGILAALALPLFNIIVKKSRFSNFASDLRTYSQAIQTYAMEAGDYPATFTTPGSLIPGLDKQGDERRLSDRWKEPSPVGGVYTWVYNTNGEAFIEVLETGTHPFAINLNDIIELDRKIDDGNLATGYLQLAGNRIRYFVKLSG